MNRRIFLESTLAFTGVLTSKWIVRFLSNDRQFSFYVAGARYFPQPTSLQVGEFVELRDVFTKNGGYSIAVFDNRGNQIGFVPREFIEKIHPLGLSTGMIIAFDFHTVPWKWYHIAVT